MCLDKGWLIGNTEIRLNLYAKPVRLLNEVKPENCGDTPVAVAGETGGETASSSELFVKVHTFYTAPNIKVRPINRYIYNECTIYGSFSPQTILW